MLEVLHHLAEAWGTGHLYQLGVTDENAIYRASGIDSYVFEIPNKLILHLYREGVSIEHVYNYQKITNLAGKIINGIRIPNTPYLWYVLPIAEIGVARIKGRSFVYSVTQLIEGPQVTTTPELESVFHTTSTMLNDMINTSCINIVPCNCRYGLNETIVITDLATRMGPRRLSLDPWTGW